MVGPQAVVVFAFFVMRSRDSSVFVRQLLLLRALSALRGERLLDTAEPPVN